MRVASALSQHVETSQAVVQTLESIHRELEGANPDLLAVFVSEHHCAQFEAIARSLRDTWPGTCLIGCGASSVIGAGCEVEGGPSIGLLAAQLPGVELTPFQLDGDVLTAPPSVLRERLHASTTSEADATSVLLLADPYTAGTEVLLASLDRALPGASVLGGVASGASGPDLSALVAGDAFARRGWVGATMRGAIDLETVVAQGCRPIGTPMFVTRSQDNFVYEIDGHPPMAIVQQLFEEADTRERALVQSSLFIGIQMQAGRSAYGQGDFLVRNITGADENTGAITVGGEVEANFVVQFHLRDAHTADEDLELALRSRTQLRERLRGALLFSCLGRGQGLYGIPNHDSDMLSRQLGPAPLAGFFGNGEIGPIDGRTHLHSYTSVFGLLCEPESARGSVVGRLQ